MLPPARPLSEEQRRLLDLFSRLDDADRRTLTAFAQFLAFKGGDEEAVEEEARVPLEPLPIPRPEKETVVGAMRRLRETYPMVDPDRLLDEASGLMSSHLLGGRPVVEVIDELEALFQRHFDSINGQ
ncbi:MAG TPA: hypothetical protein EYP90_06475 [Chromatiaceae bacterium]|nr:hypothetical protein [Chromatiaceae bacterium]